MVDELSGVWMGLSGDSRPRSVGDPVYKVGEGRDDKGWMLRTIPSSTPWSSSDFDNSGKGYSDDLLDRGEEEELGEPDDSTTMILSQLTRRERLIPRL